jgi:para-aminobenzoate synthetase/4-amino-4-deoxychorismate lyase
MRVLIQFEKKPLLFREPKSIISCSSPAAFSSCFQEIERALAGGYYVAGFLSYEAGYCFEERLVEDKTYAFPLLYMGVYEAPLRNSLDLKKYSLRSRVQDLRLNIAQDKYFSHIRAIRDYIAKGDVYQITYCIKVLCRFRGEPFSLYAQLLKGQPVPYPAYIETDGFHILSCSPEMFIKKLSRHTATKPMKGTWPRAGNPASDFLARFRFQYDEKNRAENVMIADLLRNDLGRIGCGIRTPRLYEVSRYRTLFQMTSTVTGRVDKDISVYKLFASLFPSGSVTGAPKIRAMEIIRGLEDEERKIYTGAIGYIAPNKDLFFNIPIRTLLIQGETGEMGIGGGIVWDSTPQGEWDEGLLKAKFLTEMSS